MILLNTSSSLCFTIFLFFGIEHTKHEICYLNHFLVYNLVEFSTLIMLCNSHHDYIQDMFYLPKLKLHTLSPLP